MTYKATVQHGRVVVSVDMPNGTAVEVTVSRELTFEEAVEEGVREGWAEFRRGELSTVKRVLDIARFGRALDPSEPASRTQDATGLRAVERKPRQRAKRLRQRAR